MTNAPDTAEAAIVLVAKPAPINDDDWTPVEHWVKAALRRGVSTEDAVSYRVSCETGKRQLWHLMIGHLITGVVISEVYDHPHGLTVALPVTAGEDMAAAVDPILSTIEFWARDIGAKRLEGNGRFGWIKVLKAYGWKPVRVTIAKELV
jgi:predicted RNA binding protein YcfA (HicA-like mRNA interferase family)